MSDFPSIDFMQRLEKVESTLRNTEITLKNTSDKVDKIYDAVVGNEEFDIKGIIHRVKILETESEKTKIFKQRLLGAAAFGGSMAAGIIELLKYIFTKNP
jgi:hypothetical protein